MGIGDYIWPFERKFHQIPCAREAAIAGMFGGAGLGALTVIIRRDTILGAKVIVYGGVGVFWATFLALRYRNNRQKIQSEKYIEALNTGKLD